MRMLPFQHNKPLSELSTFGIGGPARLFIEVTTIEQLQEALIFCHREKTPFLLVGKGSNSLFHDDGFDGLVILNRIIFCEENGLEVHVGGGYSFSLLGTKTAKKGLTGLEFAAGIPASVGGAIFMNAGANGGEVADSVTEVTFVDEEGIVHHYSREELEFSYRTSSFQNKKGAIAAARFLLTESPLARDKQKEIVSYRLKTQPYNQPSCGCVFRNPSVGQSAGSLIEACVLKGKRVCGAKVSSLHANFIINDGKATARDVLLLAKTLKECVKQKTGVDLDLELRSMPVKYE